MSELTKEYFDKQLGGLKTDIGNFKADIENKIEAEVAGLATMISNLEDRIDVREKVQDMDKRVKRIETALNI